MALPSTFDLLNAAHSAYYDGGLLPSTLKLLKVDGKPLTLRNDATGFFGAAFVTKSGQVIVAFEGTDLASFEDDPEFAAAQVFADYQIYLGQKPAAYGDAIRFTKATIAAAKAQGYDADDIYLSGHSLGAAEVQYVAARLNLPGESYGGPGIPLSTIPAGRASQLVNYVEYGDPVGNYNADPNPLGDFLYSEQIVRFGSASYVGNPFDVLQLNLAGQFFGPGTSDFEHVVGYALLADAAYDHHLLTHYADDLHVKLVPAKTGIDTLTQGRTLDIIKTILTDAHPVYGGRGDDTLRGGVISDTIRGGAGHDVLYGGRGNDGIYGNSGADDLVGGLGGDTLKGGAGADTFLFNGRTETSVAGAGRDTILDFSHAEHDRINLRAIDANTKADGNQAFRFIGDDAFGHQRGALQAIASGSDTLVRGDVNGDAKADFAILVHGHATLHAGDFLL